MEGQTFTISNIVIGVAVILWSVIIGMAIIAFGQLLLAIREMAHNTRKEGVHGPHYNILLLDGQDQQPAGLAGAGGWAWPSGSTCWWPGTRSCSRRRRSQAGTTI